MKSFIHSRLKIIPLILFFILAFLYCNQQNENIDLREIQSESSCPDIEVHEECFSGKECYELAMGHFFQFTYTDYEETIFLCTSGLKFYPVNCILCREIISLSGLAYLFAGYWLKQNNYLCYNEYYNKALSALDNLLLNDQEATNRESLLSDSFTTDIDLIFQMAAGIFLDDTHLAEVSMRKLEQRDHSSAFFLYLQWLFEGLNFKGLHFLQRSIEIDPYFIPSLMDFAIIQLNKGEVQRASDLLHKIIRFSSQNNDAYDNLGFLQFSEGNRQLAIEYFHRAFTLQPYDRVSEYMLHTLIKTKN